MSAASARPPLVGRSDHGAGRPFDPFPAGRAPELQRILGLSVPITVVLAERRMPIEEIIRIAVGTIIEFDVSFDSELVLHAADRPVGRGQAVKVGENFGLRITHLGPVRDRIDAMAGR